jgi:predicted transcriptional regulator
LHKGEKGKGKAIPLQVWKLCEAIDIIENATEELKRFTQIRIQECFQHLYSG